MSAQPAPSSARRLWRTAFRASVCVALTYHALACLVSAIPRDSRFYARFIVPYRTYARVTGAEQYWNMFTSAPHIRTWDAIVEVTDQHGKTHQFGPVLPGLKAYDASFFRHATILTRMQPASAAAYAKAYSEKLRREIEATTDLQVRSLVVRINIQRLKSLADIRKTGQVSFAEAKQLGPFTWES